jgi:hypothetical protein
MIAVIHRSEFTEYSETGDRFEGQLRCLRRLPRQIYEPDADTIAEFGSAAAAITAYLRSLEQFTTSIGNTPVPQLVPHEQWLTANRPLPAHTFIHTRVWLLDCTDSERAEVFKTVTQ